MVYPGFLRIGGTEVVNTERARGYAETADCPKWMVQELPCESLQDALGDQPYNYPNIALAPWYDLSLPDVSGRFYGVVGLGFKNLLDSSRSASLTEGTAPGGTIGRSRKGAKQPRVRATLLARGDDAMEYGLSWLNSAFDGICSSHGESCGTTDMEFLVDCPPPRGTMPDFTAWEPVRTNLAVNPKPPSIPAAGWTGPGVPSIGPYGYTVTNGSTTTPYIFSTPSAVGAVLGRVYAFRALVRCAPASGSAVTSMTIRPHKNTGNIYYVPAGGVISIPADGVQREVFFYWKATVDIPAGEQFNLSAVGNGTGLATTTISMDDVLIEDVGTDIPEVPPQAFFYGETPDPDALTQYRWTGATDASTSVMEVRQEIERPETDAEYFPVVDGYRRFMHDVAVISGPLVVEQRTSTDGEFRVMTVEWTVGAERPWIYSLTRPVELPITPTTVLQDTPYNLVPRPSAELPNGTVVVATNYSLNPSLETNATGWSAVAAAVTGTDPTSRVTSGRVTGELQAVGSSSFRARLLGDGAAASGRARIQVLQTVDVSSRPASSRVSATIWGALLNIGPATPLYSLVGTLTWLTAADAPVGSPVTLTPGSGGLSGNLFTAKSLVVPATATKARITLTSEFDWTSGTTNSDVRMYADALAVTVP